MFLSEFVALSDNSVWLDGLVIFHQIFKFLEENVPNTILPIDFHRTAAFQDDIKYYSVLLGVDWKAKCIEKRPSVLAYLNHFTEIKKTNDKLLVAYVYHLYMGLLSGGQILQKKRRMFNKFNPLASDGVVGYAVTDFGEHKIGDLKIRMRAVIDNLAETFDDQLKAALIEESKKVFENNNSIVRSVQGVRSAGLKKIGLFLVVIGSAYLLYRLLNTA